MNEIVIKHVPVGELPPAWRAKLAQSGDVRVTVRIEAESADDRAEDIRPETNDPLFGMWRDRQDMTDVAGYVRAIRTSRFDEC